MSADILSFIIFLPAIVAIGLMITTRDVNTIRNIAFLTTTVILALVLKLYLEFEPSSGMQFVTNVAWIETYGINYYIGLDGISLTILMMIAILIPTSYLLLWEGKTKGYWINMLLVQSGVTGTLLSESSFENIKPIINIEESNGVDENDIEFGVLKTLGWKC